MGESSAIFVCWGQEVFWRNGWYHALRSFVQLAETQVSAAVLQQGEFEVLEHLPYAARISGLVVLCDEAGCLALDYLLFLDVLF